jgi:hypothetical protein
MSAASETTQPANHIYLKISNRRTRTRVAKSAQAATQLLSVHCLYQAIHKSARGNPLFRTKVYRDGTKAIEETSEKHLLLSPPFLRYPGPCLKICVWRETVSTFKEFVELITGLPAILLPLFKVFKDKKELAARATPATALPHVARNYFTRDLQAWANICPRSAAGSEWFLVSPFSALSTHARALSR